MIWSWTWHAAALRGLHTLHPWTAARLDAAILAFAETGRGPAHQLNPPDPRRLVLLVEGAGAVLHLDPETSTLSVMRAFRRR